MPSLLVDNYLDRAISEALLAAQENRKPSGRLSASKLWWPLQWQILAVKFGLESKIDEYTLRKFQRGKDVEDWFIGQIKPLETQKFLEYRGVIGFCDSVVDTKDWDNPVGVLPLEVKSVANMKYKRILKQGADKGHKIQNTLYSLALGSEYHAVAYIASDDYRISTFIYRTDELKSEVDQIIDEFDKAMMRDTIPAFAPREEWQANMKYNQFGNFAGLSEAELKVKYQELTK